jgi:hypothetical protein
MTWIFAVIMRGGHNCKLIIFLYQVQVASCAEIDPIYNRGWTLAVVNCELEFELGQLGTDCGFVWQIDQRTPPSNTERF